MKIMKNFKSIAIIIFCMLSIKAKAQLFTWNKTVDTITNEFRDFGNNSSIIKETTDNYVIYLQNTHQISNQFGNLKYDSVNISKYTLDGNIVWKKKYLLNLGGSINDFIETPDKGFLLIGEIGLNNSVVKLDSNGNYVFIRNYLNTDSLMKLNQIAATNDGNYIIASHKEILENSCLFFNIDYVNQQNFITKINSSGNIIWQKTISTNLVRRGRNFYQTENISDIKFDFYDNANQNFNILYYTKTSYNEGNLSFNLLQFDKNGNKLDSSILSEQIVYDNTWYCINDLSNIRIKITQNGYTLYEAQQDDSIYKIKKTFYNKLGIISDTTFREIYDRNLLFNYEYVNWVQLFMTQTLALQNKIHYVFTGGISNQNNKFSYFISDTDYVASIYDGTNLIDDSIIIGTSKFLTVLNDTTLLLVSEVFNNTDTTATIKYYRISLKSNKISYSIYIDKNNNGSKDITDTAFSDCLIEFNDGNTIIDLEPNPFGAFTKYLLAGNYISKLISYNQTLKYYTVEPASKTTFFSTNTSGNDSITFRLTPKPNIQDLQVSIVPLVGARPGFNSSYKIIAKNVGTKMMYLPMVKFIKDSLQTFTDSSTYALDADTLFWQIDSLSLLEQREIIVSVLNATPPTLNANDTFHLAAVIYPIENDSFVQDNYASLNQVVVNSVDPNDKIETHGGTIPYSAVQNRDYLYYTIRFQNTGNSYATRIVITDTLTENVDASTLEFLSSSVPFVMNVVDRKHITWTAANTYLPDSIADEANSHGYISFRIKPKAGLLPSDEITNRASIVFDYNAAILTNTCTTNIIEQRILSVKNNEIKSIHLFPNPTNGNVQLNMNLLQNKNYTMRIIDINGNLLSNENLKGNAGENNVSIDLSTYANGLYFIQVSDETGNLFYGKVVKQ